MKNIICFLAAAASLPFATLASGLTSGVVSIGGSTTGQPRLDQPVKNIAAKPATTAAGPVIALIHGKAVTVKVPSGFQNVTLQERTLVQQAGKSVVTWAVVGMRPTNGISSIVTFTLRSAVPRASLRVVGELSSLASAAGAKGLSTFLADPAAGGLFNANNVGANTLTGAGVANTTLTLAGNATSDPVRSVVESDIWKVDGDRLYFFNELRGLQVFDISNPDDPAMLGQLRLPASGEQMYLLDSAHVALVTRGGDFFPMYGDSGLLSRLYATSDQGAVVIANVGSGSPVVGATLNYPGYLVESRLVGHVLYIISEVYSQTQDGLQATSFDLSDPAKPVQRDTLYLGSYGGVVTATDQYLFVASYGANWTNSNIAIIDISSPTGALKKRGQLTTAGTVNNKYNLNLNGTVLTAVSGVAANWSADQSVPANQPRTKVENFSLANPDAPALLGTLEIGIGESVRATRFADNRLYVVTYFQIDPLWVVDLSVPAQPSLLGELKVPGFSTYIDPLGDRLVAIGYVNEKTAVSLFDVSDPANPAVLSQIPLGDGYSYSDANWDEKAFTVLPEQNLIMVPYSGYDASSGYASQVQLIDLNQNSLTARGVIDHAFATRRTAVVNNRILALSSSDLVTVNFDDRDHPQVTSDVEIAWRVDRVFLCGNYLVQIGGSADWQNNEVTLTISGSNTPDTILTSVDLGQVPVVGAALKNGRLYVAQQASSSFWYGGPILAAAGSSTSTAPANPLTLSVYDATNLPALPLLGSTQADVSAAGSYGGQDLAAVWPRADVLVWMRPQTRFFRPYLLSGVTTLTTSDLTKVGSGSSVISAGNLNLTGTTFSNGTSLSLGTAVINPGNLTIFNTSALNLNNAGTLTLTGITNQNMLTTGLLPNSLSGVVTANGAGTLTTNPSGLVVASTAHSATAHAPVTRSVKAAVLKPVSSSNALVINSGLITTNAAVTSDASGATLTLTAGGTSISSATANLINVFPIWGWYNSDPGDDAIAFDVSNPAAPALASTTKIHPGSTGNWSAPIALNNQVFTSYMAFDTAIVTISPETSSPAPARTNRNFLVAVNYTDATKPVVSAEVNIPGQLLAMEQGGTFLLTTGPSYDATGACLGGTVFHSSSFDGTTATLIDELPSPGSNGAYAVENGTLFLSADADAATPNSVAKPAPGTLQAWQVGATGNFNLAGQLPAASAYNLTAVHGLLVAQGNSSPHLFDVSKPAQMHDLGAFDTNAWLSLDHADGGAGLGLWLPLGAYGVDVVPVAH